LSWFFIGYWILHGAGFLSGPYFFLAGFYVSAYRSSTRLQRKIDVWKMEKFRPCGVAPVVLVLWQKLIDSDINAIQYPSKNLS